MRTPPSSFVRPVILLLAFTLLLGRPAAAAAEPSSPHAASYIVFEINGSRVTPVSQRMVILDAPLESTSAAAVADALAQPSRAITPIVVTLQASNGAEVYRTVVETSPWLRAEFHGAGEGAPIDGQILPSPQTVFVARVPAIPDSTLTLRGADLRTLGRWDMTRLAAETPRIELPAHAAVAASGDGPPANRVDLLLMGDGYTAGEADKFRADVTKFAEDFASLAPLSTYANYMNVTSLFTPSAESGADHPPYKAGCPAGDPTCCGDPAMQYDALQGRMVSTAFDARYCVSNIHRLLVGNGSKIVAAAAAVPDWDLIAVIVNDPTYGGAGGGIIYASMHPSTTQIAQHEFGHSFARLADEYESPYPGYPSCSDINGPACESNVTDITAREKVKWAPWILPATPIVTPETNDYAGVVGLFEGARYREKGIYRPGLSCIMRSLGAPFCQVPSQSHVLRLYSGGWGQPPGGISLIEPGSTAPKTPARVVAPSTLTFSATVLQPVGGPPVELAWFEDDVQIAGEDRDELTYSPTRAGARVITLRVTDPTPLVHPDMAGQLLRDEYKWTVNVVLPTTTTIISHLPNPSGIGEEVTVRFAVTSKEGAPSGDVTVSDGAVSCTATVSEGACALRLTTPGLQTLTARYAGDESFAESVSAGATHSVVRRLRLPLIRR